jgi:hypothetical protein
MDLNDFTNNNFASPKPVLTEPGVKYFLSETLKQCHIIKNNFHNTVFNIGMLIAFLLILGLILLYKYKEKQQYVLSKIKNLQEAKRRAHQELITGLPNWDSEYDIIHRNKTY